MSIDAFESSAFDPASFQVAANADLSATETQDTLSAGVSAWHIVLLVTSEGNDGISSSASVYWPMQLGATEAEDELSAALEARHEVALDVTEASDTATGGLSLYSAIDLAATESLDTIASDVLSHWKLDVASADYLTTGYGARLYQSAFFYNDVEVIFVPPEVRRMELSSENRTIFIRPKRVLEILEEDREVSAEPRLRVR